MHHSLLLVLHLFAAFVFVGTVFFEVVMLDGIRARVPREAMRPVEIAIGARARRIMPWALVVLYAAGAGMAWDYRAVLTHPWSSSFGTLLTIKIALALSVLAHFITAMIMGGKGLLKSRYVHRIHISVFSHMIFIVLLAKLMFVLKW